MYTRHMGQEEKYISALEKLGVQVELIAPKRKDNLQGLMLRIQMKGNAVPKDIASVLGDFIADAGYSYSVTLNDNEYGSHTVDDIDGSIYPRSARGEAATRIGKNPLVAIDAAMERVRSNLVSSFAQDRALREEEDARQALDMDRNAAIFNEENAQFHFDLESVWAFAEK